MSRYVHFGLFYLLDILNLDIFSVGLFFHRLNLTNEYISSIDLLYIWSLSLGMKTILLSQHIKHMALFYVKRLLTFFLLLWGQRPSPSVDGCEMVWSMMAKQYPITNVAKNVLTSSYSWRKTPEKLLPRN